MDVSDAINQGFDLSQIVKQGASNVPLWAIGLFIIRNWFNRMKKAEVETKQALAGLHEKINRMEMKLAESGISDLKQNIEALKEFRTEASMNFKALWRSVDKDPRKSDQ